MIETELPPRAGSALPLKKTVNATYTELQDFDVKRQPTSHSISPAVQAWPMQPKPLVLAQQERILLTLFDAILIALPLCLIIKTGLCIHAYNTDKENTGLSLAFASPLSRLLVQLNAQLVTLFTIVFITIISTFVKRYALWKAQYGAYVSDLEQLQGSISLPSTLKLIWSLRSFGVKSVVLTLVWSFYYLGSQAVKLEYRLSLSDDYRHIKTPVQQYNSPSYFTPDLDDAFTRNGYPRDSSDDLTLDIMNIQFGALVLDIITSSTTASQKTSGSSSSGPLIPDYHTVASMETSLIDEVSRKLGGWIDISEKARSLGTYVSYVGQNLWLDAGTSVTNATMNQSYFEIESFLGTYTLKNISYINISCGHPVVRPAWTFPNGTSPNSSASFNMTMLSSDAARDINGYPLRQFDYWWRGFTAVPPPGVNTSDPSAAGIGGYDPSFNYTLRAVQSTCSLSTKYIDMKVECLATGCYASRLRWANNTNEGNATGYSTPFDSDQFATNFWSNFTLSTGVQNDLNTFTLVGVTFFLDAAFNSSLWSTLGPAVCMRSCADYSFDYWYSKLAMGLNSYHTLSQTATAMFLGSHVAKILHGEKHSDDFFMEVTAKGAKLDQGYRLYWQWIPIDFVACSILLAAAIGAYWLRVNTLAPDIFGYVSSLTRDNPHLSLPTEASSLSGIERARMLKGVKVRIGDVQGRNVGESSSIGRVGLAPVNAEVRPLHNQGLYM